jgi:hypothetical protein
VAMAKLASFCNDVCLRQLAEWLRVRLGLRSQVGTAWPFKSRRHVMKNVRHTLVAISALVASLALSGCHNRPVYPPR